MLELLTTFIVCNSGKNITCLAKNIDVIKSSKVIIVCKKKDECEPVTVRR